MENGSIGMSSFDVEITRFAPEPVVRRTAGVDADTAVALVRAAGEEPCVVLVTQLTVRGAGEDFYLWLAADRAIVRRDAHREWYARERATAPGSGDVEIPFIDDDGSSFAEPASNTVSRADALSALAYWLRTGELTPTLGWV